MNARRRSFIRKMIYLAVMIPLGFALIYIGQPSTSGNDKHAAKPGGKLAQIRAKYDLDQSKWGEIDPAGQAMKLATFGLRGVAANLLWHDALEAKKKKDWTKLTATLGQIVKLQPNYIKVWEFQAWNLAYNCSAEFDDYRDRYRWVIRGIQFLQEGVNYNKKDPRLYKTIGWTTSQKIGRSDEKDQFRELFPKDEEFFENYDRFYPKGSRPENRRDNWLVGKDWYDKAADLHEKDGRAPLGDSYLVFRSKSPMCLIYYADSLEKDGTFGDRAKKAWNDASQAWIDYGTIDIPSIDVIVQLGKLGSLKKQLQDKSDQLEKLAPEGTKKRLEAIRLANLSKAQIEALKTDEQLRTPEQDQLVIMTRPLLEISYEEINRAVEGKNREEADKVLKEIKKIQAHIARTNTYRGIVNYEYWGNRAQIEQSDMMLLARELAYQAQKEFQEGGDLVEASKAFENSIVAWAEILRSNENLIAPDTGSGLSTADDTLMTKDLLMTDRGTQDDVNDLIEQYGKLLDQEDSLFPADFPLAFFVRYQAEQNDKMPAIRKFAIKVQEAIAQENWILAQESLENELGQWSLLMADIPSLMQGSDLVTANHVLQEIRNYAGILAKQDKPFPESFALRQFVWTLVAHDPDTLEARNAYAKGRESLAQKEYRDAKSYFDLSIINWQKVLDRYPSIIADRSLCREMVQAVDAYRTVLEAQKEEFPKEVPLKNVLDRWSDKVVKPEVKPGK